MTKIEQLESELTESLDVQCLLRERLKSNTKTLGEVENLLKAIEANLKCSNDYVYQLKQENLKLKLSCDGWIKRAIKLEFGVLNARDAAKKQSL